MICGIRFAPSTFRGTVSGVLLGEGLMLAFACPSMTSTSLWSPFRSLDPDFTAESVQHPRGKTGPFGLTLETASLTAATRCRMDFRNLIVVYSMRNSHDQARSDRFRWYSPVRGTVESSWALLRQRSEGQPHSRDRAGSVVLGVLGDGLCLPAYAYCLFPNRASP